MPTPGIWGAQVGRVASHGPLALPEWLWLGEGVQEVAGPVKRCEQNILCLAHWP